MKNAFTTSYSELVQNPIEFALTIDVTLADAVSGNAPTDQIAQVRKMLNILDAQVDGSARCLVSKYDEAASLFENDQPGTTST